MDYQCSLVAIICVPENHAAISETVHKEIDAAIECNEKVTNQKYLGTNRNFLKNKNFKIDFYYFLLYIFQLHKLTHTDVTIGIDCHSP